MWMTSKTLKQIKCIMKKLDITIVCPWLCNLCSLFALTKEQNNVFVCLLVFLCALLFYTRSEDMQGWPVTLCLYCSARKQFVLFVCSSPKSLSLATWQQIKNKRIYTVTDLSFFTAAKISFFSLSGNIERTTICSKTSRTKRAKRKLELDLYLSDKKLTN